MKFLVIDASTRNGFTRHASEKYYELLGNVDKSIVRISDLIIDPCIGCNICLRKPESECPHYSDDCKYILDLILEADAIIYFIPNFSLNIPGKLKMLFDRLAFVFHRPRLFGKVSTCFVVEGVYGGKNIIKYHNELMSFWGSNIIKGEIIKGGLSYKNEFINEELIKLFQKNIRKLQNKLNSNLYQSPTLFRLMIFRMTRSSMKYFDEATPVDKAYYKAKGWNDSTYYYPVKMNIFKILIGYLFDNIIIFMSKKKPTTA